MPAERWRLTKYELNPIGTWATDDNRLGQKLLEKMGWKKGEGLGAAKQGIKKTITLPYKWDYAGIGFKEFAPTNRGFEETSKQRDIREELAIALTEINKIYENINKSYSISSLEKMSKKSKTRVHYHNITRGKDISRYSKHELLSILGPNAHIDDLTNLSIANSSDEPNGIDYNEEEVSSLKSNRVNNSNYEEEITTSLGGEESWRKRKHKKYYFNDNDSFNTSSNINDENVLSEVEKKKKSKSRQENMDLCKNSEENNCYEVLDKIGKHDICIDNVSLELKQEKKKHKKRISKYVSDELEENGEMSNCIDTDNLSVNKKIKKSKQESMKADSISGEVKKDCLIDFSNINTSDGVNRIGYNEEKTDYFESNRVNNATNEKEITFSASLDGKESVKKRKHKEHHSNDINFNINNLNEESILFENGKKKKKRESKEGNMDIDICENSEQNLKENLGYEMLDELGKQVTSIENVFQEVGQEKKKQKKRKCKYITDEQDVEVSTYHVSTDISSVNECKKRKKSKQESITLLDNSYEHPQQDNVNNSNKEFDEKENCEIKTDSISVDVEKLENVSFNASAISSEKNIYNYRMTSKRKEFGDPNFDSFVGSNLIRVSGYASK